MFALLTPREKSNENLILTGILQKPKQYSKVVFKYFHTQRNISNRKWYPWTSRITCIPTDIDKDINPQIDKCIDLRSLMFDHAITKLEREYH